MTTAAANTKPADVPTIADPTVVASFIDSVSSATSMLVQQIIRLETSLERLDGMGQIEPPASENPEVTQGQLAELANRIANLAPLNTRLENIATRVERL